MNKQTILGFNNKQEIVQIIVDEKYLSHLLTFPNNPTDLNRLVLNIYEGIVDNDKQYEKRNLPPDIEEKLDYNNVCIYKFLIESNYSENAYYLDSAYQALDDETPGRKKIFLNYINSIYLTSLGELAKEYPELTKLELIRQEADTIIGRVISILTLKISNNNKGLESLSSESINLNIFTIVCHAFVDCKVLENPNN